MSEALDVVFLDAAGTLIRPVEPVGEVYARVAGSWGLALEGRLVGERFGRVWRGMAGPRYVAGPDERVDRAWWREVVRRTLTEAAGGRLPEGFDVDGCFGALWAHYAEPAAWQVFGDVEPALRRMAGLVPLGVLSNFDERLERVLDGLGLREWFRWVVRSSAVGAVKPDEAIFRHACAVAGSEPQRCLHAGDDPRNDWDGARRAGLRTFALARPHRGMGELAALVARAARGGQ